MDNTDNKQTSIEKLGKFGLIDHLAKNARKENKTTVIGIGDDSAVIGSGSDVTLVSTDLFLEGIHFNLTYTPLKHLGYKAVIRGISDIYAMNGTPGQVLVALGISTRFSLGQVDEIYEGINLACEKYGVDLVGGDITSSITGLTIAITATGHCDRDDVIRRNGAKANDLICVTGDFGAAYMGLQLLERERKLFRDKSVQPDLEGYAYVVGRQLKPEFPVKILSDLKEAGIRPTAMIDVSDGLASDLIHLCKLSDTGCRIFAERIPVDYETEKLAEEFNVDPIIPALNGGEDYELLFTVALDQLDKIKQIQEIKMIGHMTESGSGKILTGSGGTEIPLHAQGWVD